MERVKQRPKTFVALISVTGLITLIFVVATVYAASDHGKTGGVTWSYWVGSLAYSGSAEKTDSHHTYNIWNNSGKTIKLGWEFSHKVLNPAGAVVHDATEWDEGALIEIPSDGRRHTASRLIRTSVAHLAEDQMYTITAYTAIRIHNKRAKQLFGEGDDDGEELDFWR